jgi:hypothetical protein
MPAQEEIVTDWLTTLNPLYSLQAVDQINGCHVC